MKKDKKVSLNIKNFILLTVAGIVNSIGVTMFLAPVKLYDGGPVIFKQERATIHGRRFEVYKLRTMKQNVERSIEIGPHK